MARIQPSFLRFYLFQSQQHNTSFLLTSKGEIKYPGGSFPKQPKPFTLSTAFYHCPLVYLLSLFQQLTRVLYLFIYLVNYISPSSTIQNRDHKFSSAYHKTHQNIAPIFPNFPSPFSEISSSIQWSGLLPNPKNSRPHYRGISQSAGLATNQYLKILDPF